MLIDNKQTISLLTNPEPILTTKLKHVDVHHFWLREMVQLGKIKIAWIPGKEMPADGLTKLLPRQGHVEFVKKLGLQPSSVAPSKIEGE